MAAGRIGAQQKKAAVLAAYAKLGTILHACEAAGVDRRTHYKWLESDAEYADAFADAREDAADLLEREARKRSSEGWLEPVFYEGEQVATVRKYSDTLLIFLLKGDRPEKYRERVSNEITGPNGGKLEVTFIPPHRD